MNKMYQISSFRILVTLVFAIFHNCIIAQEHPKITSNDEVVIKRKAIGLIDDLANKYNQLLDADSEDRKVIIENMILPNSDNFSTFVDDQVIIEDDFNTRELSTNEKLMKKVDIYFKDICFNYGRGDNGEFLNDGKNVIFSNIRTSRIMAVNPAAPLFIKVFFDINYTGIDKRTSKPFINPSNRVAEIKIEKSRNTWNLSIITIRYLQAEEADFSRNVRIQQETLTLESKKTLLEIEDKVLSKVIVKSNVNTARVRIDGVEIGYLKNSKLEYFIRPGIYKFELLLDKFENAVLETVVRLDSTVTVFIPMKKMYSNVNFKIEPNDATVLLNNQPIGTGSFSIALPKGRHDLIIDKKGYKPEKTTIDIVNDDTELSYQIFKITKTIELISSPPNALVTSNRDTLGKTPLSLNLPYGQYNLIVTQTNYIPKQMLINVENSGIERFDVLLVEKPEFTAQREANKLRRKAVTGFLINGVLAGAAYSGSKFFDRKSKDADTSKDDKDLYNAGKYITIGLAGIFAIASTVNLVKIFTISKSKIQRKKLEEKTNLSFSPLKNGGMLTLRTSF